MSWPIAAVLFDLDGTLVDTAADLAAAVNRMLAALGRTPLAVQTVAGYVGKGTRKLVERSLGGALEPVGLDPVLFERGLALFETAYLEESGRHARVYPGVVEGLDQLRARGLGTACVTNKPERFTHPLLAATGLAARFDAVVGGDTVARAKPDPLPYRYACERLGVAPAAALVVGDSENDAVAGRAAGCRVLCVTYGYTEGRPVRSIVCDGFIDDCREIARFIA